MWCFLCACCALFHLISSDGLHNETDDWLNDSYSTTSSVDSEMIVDCSARNCFNTEIGAAGIEVDSVTILCAEGRCENSTLHCGVGQESSCFIECSGDHACLQTTVIADSISVLTILCSAAYSCENMLIEASYVTDINLVATYHRSFGSGILSAQYTRTIDIECSAPDTNSACQDAYFDVGAAVAETTLHCYGLGCHDVQQIRTSTSSIAPMTVNINGCGECNDTSECIGDMDLLCGSETATITDGACTGSGDRLGRCDCETFALGLVFVNSLLDSKCAAIEDGKGTVDVQQAAWYVFLIISVLLFCCYLAGCCFWRHVYRSCRHTAYAPAAAGGLRPAQMVVDPAMRVQAPPQPMMYQTQAIPAQPMAGQPIMMQPQARQVVYSNQAQTQQPLQQMMPMVVQQPPPYANAPYANAPPEYAAGEGDAPVTHY